MRNQPTTKELLCVYRDVRSDYNIARYVGSKEQMRMERVKAAALLRWIDERRSKEGESDDRNDPL